MGYLVANSPPPKPLDDAQMGGASFFLGWHVKPSLSFGEQVALLVERELAVPDPAACEAFFSSNSYYRFSGYARYFQQAPHLGDDTFVPGATFDCIRAIYDADAALRAALVGPLAAVEVLLRAQTAHVIAETHGPYGHYLDEGYYSDAGSGDSTVDACLRDIRRSKERHILRFTGSHAASEDLGELPVWSAVESWSFGTLSKCIERGAKGTLQDSIAASLGIAKAGFAYRVRTLVYLRNRCAHHSRLWNHSIVDAGPTPNNVRAKAKRLAGQFEPRSLLDALASLDDILTRTRIGDPLLPELAATYPKGSDFWNGLVKPQTPRDHRV